MPRYKLTVEYDGGPFAGFQLQAELATVQGVMEAAVLAFSGEAVRVHVAGRTDTGVHATGQVAHIELLPATGGPMWCAMRSTPTSSPTP